MPCQVEKEKWGDYGMNYQTSAINNSTPLHFTPLPPSGHAWKQQHQQRTDPIRCGCGWLVVLFIVPTAHSRATEPVIGGVPPLDGICLAETSHSGYWSCYKVRTTVHKKNEPKNKRTNRVTISSRKGTAAGCSYRRRRCVLVGHENCRCPKIFPLLLLRPPKLHVQWSSTCSIIQAVYLAVKR